MQIPTQSLLPNQMILESTLALYYKNVSGTSFMINGSKGQYLVTAKHIFQDTIENTSVEVNIKGAHIDEKITCNIFFHENLNVDIAILKLTKPLIIKKLPALGRGDSYYIGQQCIFLGFPLFSLGTQTESGKLAFVKKAIISAFYDKNDGTTMMLLDGHNNPGFSGGPIITYSETMDKQFIIGVISGYYYQKNEISITDKMTEINENSGIIISYASEYILDIIKKIEIG